MDIAKDVVERSGWTGAEAALAIAITELGGVNVWWAAPVALVLTAAKVWVHSHLKPKPSEAA